MEEKSALSLAFMWGGYGGGLRVSPKPNLVLDPPSHDLWRDRSVCPHPAEIRFPPAVDPPHFNWTRPPPPVPWRSSEGGSRTKKPPGFLVQRQGMCAAGARAAARFQTGTGGVDRNAARNGPRAKATVTCAATLLPSWQELVSTAKSKCQSASARANPTTTQVVTCPQDWQAGNCDTALPATSPIPTPK